jgi:hypothetical protein
MEDEVQAGRGQRHPVGVAGFDVELVGGDRLDRRLVGKGAGVHVVRTSRHLCHQHVAGADHEVGGR